MDIFVLILSVISLISWLVYFPYAVITLYCLKNIPRYERDNKDIKKISCDKFIIFRFVTRGKHKKLINSGILSVINSCNHLNFENYRVEVVTDTPTDNFLDINAPNKIVKIVVPKDYQTKKGTKYKGRALNYAIERTKTSKNIWILHLDEESKVTKQTIYSILSYLNDNPKVAAEGAINYPHEFGKNIITSLLEGERSTSCLFCISQLEIDPIWLHGSNLLVRSDIEKLVGWDFGSDSIAEDARFGYEVIRKLGSKAFGWHGGTMLEQPTFTIRDTIRQRQRWFVGAIRNLKHLPTGTHRTIETYFLTTWTLGFFASFFGIPALLGYFYIPVILKPFLFFCLVVWAMSYQIGLYLNIRHLKIALSDKVLYHIAAIILLPILGIVSTFPTVLSVFRRPTTFEIVQKEHHELSNTNTNLFSLIKEIFH